MDSLQDHSSPVVIKKSDLERQQRAILKYFAMRIPFPTELPVLERGERTFFCKFFECSEIKHLEAEALACEKLGVSVSFFTVF